MFVELDKWIKNELEHTKAQLDKLGDDDRYWYGRLVSVEIVKREIPALVRGAWVIASTDMADKLNDALRDLNDVSEANNDLAEKVTVLAFEKNQLERERNAARQGAEELIERLNRQANTIKLLMAERDLWDNAIENDEPAYTRFKGLNG